MPGSFAVEALGVGAATTEFSLWGWAFCPQPVTDFGIDAHVEPYDGKDLWSSAASSRVPC